jgi:hypothetical protein
MVCGFCRLKHMKEDSVEFQVLVCALLEANLKLAVLRNLPNFFEPRLPCL